MNFKKIAPHLVVVIGFVILALAYCSPVLQNKLLVQHDPVQSVATAHESVDFKEKNGEWAWWTNSLFGGMPTYFLAGSYPYGVFAKLGYHYNPLPGGAPNNIFYCLLGAYILLLVLGSEIWLAVLGAIAYAFCSYTILYIEAGHISKIVALSFAPFMIAGLLMAFKGRKIWGAILFAIGLGFEINANHIQITYYTFIAIGIIILYQLYLAIKQNQVKDFILALVFVGITGGLALGTNVARLWSNYEYSKESIRGKSELSLNKDNKPSDGLDKDYAFSWSYGKLESMSLLIPSFSGGASNGEFGTKSKTYQTLISSGVPVEQAEQAARSMPSYWGDQSFVAGPAYAGAIICFLFILGIFLSDNKWKIPFTVITVLFLFISWGKNLFINDIFFDYLPLFNKFRAVSMIISLFQLFLVAVGVMGLKTIVDTKPSFESIKKPLLYSFLLTGGISLVFALMPTLFLDFRAATDEAFLTQLKTSFGGNGQAVNDVYNSILEDRASILKADAWRSFMFIALTMASIWLFVTNKIKKQILLPILTLLVLVDLWAVDKRYLNNEDFKPNYKTFSNLFTPTAADQQILQDKDPNFKVLNTTTSFWQDGKDSYFHKSIGGYHGAKLKIMQELYENQMIKDQKLNLPIFNMLNTKYFIVGGQNGEPMAQRNPDALGNAWFVTDIKWVNSANDEMKAMDNFNPKTTAIVDKRFTDLVKNKNSAKDTTSKIKLIEYQPNKLVYESTSKEAQLAVFSEVYYRGNQDWTSTIDGKEAPHLRANYVLRALEIPAGKHKIEFAFKPVAIEKGNKIDLISSILLGLVIVGGIFWEMKGKKKE